MQAVNGSRLQSSCIDEAYTISSEKTANIMAEQRPSAVIEERDGSNTDPSASFSSDSSREIAYTFVRVLGSGAFGEAVLYRKVEVRQHHPQDIWCRPCSHQWRHPHLISPTFITH